MRAGLVDTSVWISTELGRAVDRSRMPDELHISVITVAELQAGVLAARDAAAASARLRTLENAQAIEPLPVDAAVAAEWALIRVEIGRSGRRINVNDLWIAATARAHRLPVVTQDDDFDVVADLGLIQVHRV